MLPITPGYDYQTLESASWGTFVDEPAMGYTSTLGNPLLASGAYRSASMAGISEWPAFGDFSPPIPSGDGLTSPTAWPAAETDSESCEHDLFSPVGGDAATSPRWSWSQPSSPIVDTELTFGSSPPPKLETSTRSRTKPAARSSSNTAKAKPAPKLTPKLRTAARKPRKSSTSKPTPPSATTSSPEEAGAGEVVSPDEVRARRNHNLVEKQYRNRLNAQFERLLSVLPPDQRRLTQDVEQAPSTRKRRASCSSGTGSLEDRRMSKAEVLDVATRRIRELEADRSRLLREKKILLQDMEVMNGAVAEAVVRGRGRVGS